MRTAEQAAYAPERGLADLVDLVDDVIDPRGTRSALIRSPAMPRSEHADLPSHKHGNPPV